MDVDEGVVLSQSHDVSRRCHGADGVADTYLVENLDTRRMDGMRRENLIAWKPVPVQEQDGSSAPSEERRERCAGAPGADDDDIKV
jgi:hypothetical protein